MKNYLDELDYASGYLVRGTHDPKRILRLIQYMASRIVYLENILEEDKPSEKEIKKAVEIVMNKLTFN